MNKSVIIVLVLIFSLASGALGAAGDFADAVGVKGGFVVCVGCEDGKRLASLGANDSFVVQGLSDDPEAVATAREHIQSADLYGKVSVGLFDGKQLPYVESLVNLLVISDVGELSADEIKRVLVPGGVALIKGRQNVSGLKTARVKKLKGWKAFKKPWPVEIDEWTHYLHDASNNAVAHDDLVGPPSRLQWLGSPRYARHHDRMSSISAVISCQGRVFYIFDEATPISILAPPKWMLMASPS